MDCLVDKEVVPSSVADMLVKRDDIQKDKYSLEKQASRCSTRPSARSCTCVGQSPASAQTGQWTDWEQSCGKGLGDNAGWKFRYKLAMHACSPESQLHPGPQKKRHCMASRPTEMTVPLLLHTSKTLPEVLSSVLGPPAQKSPVRAGLEEGDKKLFED